MVARAGVKTGRSNLPVGPALPWTVHTGATSPCEVDLEDRALLAAARVHGAGTPTRSEAKALSAHERGDSDMCVTVPGGRHTSSGADQAVTSIETDPQSTDSEPRYVSKGGTDVVVEPARGRPRDTP